MNRLLIVILLICVNMMRELYAAEDVCCNIQEDPTCEEYADLPSVEICHTNLNANTKKYHIDFVLDDDACDGVNVHDSAGTVPNHWGHNAQESAWIWKWQASETTTISGFKFYGGTSQSVQYSAALFGDNNGRFSNVLSSSSSRVTMPSTYSQTRIDINPVSVTTGTSYWIAFRFHGNAFLPMSWSVLHNPPIPNVVPTPLFFNARLNANEDAGDLNANAYFAKLNFFVAQIQVVCDDAPTNTAPNAICQDVTKVADNTCSASVTASEVNNGSNDPDGNSLSYSVNPSSFSGVGTYNTVLSVSDGELSDTCSATVNVQDQTVPVITCPIDKVLECTDDTSPSNTEMASATDNCDNNVDITYNDIVSGDNDDTPHDYTITRTWTATDDDGNASNCVQTIDVKDTEEPKSDGENTFEIGPVNHKMHSISLEQCLEGVTFSDNCEDESYVRDSARFISVSSNEDTNGNEDYEVVNDDEVNVRADRNGNGNGRVYTLTYEFNDSSGNSNQAYCYVNVPHNNGNGKSKGKNKSIITTVTASAATTTLSVFAIVAVLAAFVAVGTIIRRRRRSSNNNSNSNTSNNNEDEISVTEMDVVVS